MMTSPQKCSSSPPAGRMLYGGAALTTRFVFGLYTRTPYCRCSSRQAFLSMVCPEPLAYAARCEEVLVPRSCEADYSPLLSVEHEVRSPPPGLVVCEDANVLQLLRRLRSNWSYLVAVDQLEWIHYIAVGLFGMILLIAFRHCTHATFREFSRDFHSSVGVPVQNLHCS